MQLSSRQIQSKQAMKFSPGWRRATNRNAWLAIVNTAIRSGFEYAMKKVLDFNTKKDLRNLLHPGRGIHLR